MQAQRFRFLSRGAAVIAVFVVAAVVTAIYVIGRENGNVVSTQCRPAQQLASTLKPLAVGEVAAFQLAEPPEPIGQLAFNDAEGAGVSIADWKGRTVLLNLWATWCAPCREEMPELEALEQEMGGEDFAVLPISVDAGQPDKPKNFYAETDLTGLPFYHDGTMGVFNDLKKRSLAIGMPTTLLIDDQGCVLGKISGPAAWASEDAKALIGAAMKKAG